MTASVQPQAEVLAYRIGAANGRVSAESAAFIAYAKQHAAPLWHDIDDIDEAPAQIAAQLHWHENPPPPRAALVGDLERMQRPDRDLYVGGDRIAWFRIDDFRNLVLQAQWDGTTLRVRGDYHFYLSRVGWRDRIRRLWEARQLPAQRQKRFATLLYYLAYYPAMWWHETCDGAHPIHAAGVVGEHAALVLAGPSGVGKSTMTVALTAAGGTPLSETFLLHRGREMIAVPEPVLLDAWSRAWLGDGVGGLERAPGRFVFERAGFHLGTGMAQAPAGALIVPRRGEPAGAAPISAEEAHRRISTGHQLIKDMRRYWAYAAALENLAPGATGLMLRREQALASLTAQVPCWELRLTPELSRADVTEILADIAARSDVGGLAARLK